MRDVHVIIVGSTDKVPFAVMETVGNSIIKIEQADNADNAGRWGMGMLDAYNADVLINRFDGSTITRKQYRRMCEEAR